MGKYEDIRPGATMAENTPVYPPLPTAPEGTPNIVFCVFDDVGFSDFGCYGSEIRTPILIASLVADFVIRTFIQLHCAHQHARRC